MIYVASDNWTTSVTSAANFDQVKTVQHFNNLYGPLIRDLNVTRGLYGDVNQSRLQRTTIGPRFWVDHGRYTYNKWTLL